VEPYYYATYYFIIGENDQGFRYLDEAFEERDPWLVTIKVDPYFDGIRNDPRFKALLKKMNLE